MKMIKRVLTLVLALCLLLGLAACRKKPAGDSESANGQEWVWANRYEGTFSDEGYYYLSKSAFLYYLDTASGVTTALCTKAGCLHDKMPDHRQYEQCEAYFSNIITFKLQSACFWKGNLYFLTNDTYGIQLYRCDATGSGKMVLGELGTRYTGEQKAVSHSKYAMADGFLYYYGTVSSSVWDDDRSIWTPQRELDYISRVDLSTGEEEIIIEDRENTLELLAVQENAVLYTEKSTPDVDISDPGYREALKRLPIALKCRNGETGQVNTLFQKTGRECEQVRMVSGGKVYYSAAEGNGVNTYTYDLTTGEDKLFVKADGMWYWGNDYVRRKNSQTNEWYLYHIGSQKNLPIDIKEGNISLENSTDRGCILSWLVLPEGGQKENRYCYVTYEALADGLQEEDLVLFHTAQNSH